MLEHPDITRVNLTGYPHQQTKPTNVSRCTTCKTENGFIGHFWRLYDDYDFCSQEHMVDWLIKNGDVVRVEVSD